MKHFFSLAVILVASFNAFAQAPKKLKYRTIIRNEQNVAVGGKYVDALVYVIQDSVSGKVVFSEKHHLKTNYDGAAIIVLGSGTPVMGSFENIDWSGRTNYLQTEVAALNFKRISKVKRMPASTATIAKPATDSAKTTAADTSTTKQVKQEVKKQNPKKPVIADTSLVTNKTTAGNITNTKVDSTSKPAKASPIVKTPIVKEDTLTKVTSTAKNIINDSINTANKQLNNSIPTPDSIINTSKVVAQLKVDSSKTNNTVTAQSKSQTGNIEHPPVIKPLPANSKEPVVTKKAAVQSKDSVTITNIKPDSVLKVTSNTIDNAKPVIAVKDSIKNKEKPAEEMTREKSLALVEKKKSTTKAVVVMPETKHASIGKEYYDNKNYDSAIVYFTKAIENDSNNAMLYVERGKAKSKLSNHREAMTDFNSAIELDTALAVAYFKRGNCKSDLKDTRGAIKDYKQAIKFNPSYAKAYYNMAVMEIRLKNYFVAVKHYDKVIELEPKWAMAYYNRGIYKMKIGMQDSACEDFSKAGELGFSKAYSAIKKKCN